MQANSEPQQGKIVVAADEYTLTDVGFLRAPDTETFVKNIANWFTGGAKGKFHVYSANGGLIQSRLAKVMTDAGHTWTVNVNQKFDLDTLKQYNGVFLGAEPKDNQVLIDYVKAGGNVYLMGGTGYGGGENEAKQWKTFLNEFGLEFSPHYINIDGNLVINSNHPIFAGVKCLYCYIGQPILNTNTDANHQVFETDPGLYAAFENPGTPQGKIVVSADEWPLTDTGFVRAPDTEIFVKNITNWFTGGAKGKFHAYSSNGGLVQSRLAKAMANAGHTWTVNVNQKFDLDTLKQYNGVFVGGEPKDNQVLIDYVKAGGNVYLMAGTSYGGYEDEAKRWKTFLNEFGLEISPHPINIDGNLVITSNHPIFAGVKCLFSYIGQPILNTKPDVKNQEVFHSDPGLYAAFENPGTPQGKIVVSADEFPLTDTGFVRAPDTEIFVKNITNWFTGGAKGKFHAYSSSHGVHQSRLAKAMTDAGHTWTVNVGQKFDLDTLKQYNGVFVGGEPKDNQVLIDYVKAGGNVYLMAGTSYGGYEDEAKRWKTFLNEFGLEISPYYINIDGNRTINSSHPIFAGVKCLYSYVGQPILNTKPDAKDHQVFYSDPGLYAAAVYNRITTSGQFEVKSNSDTGVEFTNTQTKEVSYTFVPSGTWIPGKREEGFTEVTAAGVKGMSPELQTVWTESLKDLQKYLKYPNNTAFALLAVNKTTGVVTEVSAETTIVVKPGETLVFIVNDFPPDYGDNVGTLTVKWSAVN
jgi:uncharacterized membrane protein